MHRILVYVAREISQTLGIGVYALVLLRNNSIAAIATTLVTAL